MRFHPVAASRYMWDKWTETSRAEYNTAFKNAQEIRSAVAEHAFNTGHGIDWESTRAIDFCRGYHNRLLLEPWHILRKRFSMSKEQSQSFTTASRVMTAPS